LIYGMLISAVLTFLMLGLAKQLPDPWWMILLNLQEMTLCAFVFFTFGIFLRTFEASKVKLRYSRLSANSPKVSEDDSQKGRWKLMLAVLFAFAALAYRYSTFKAFAAMSDQPMTAFNPWENRGNVFFITAAFIATTIAASKLKAPSLLEKLLAYSSAVLALVSFAPLLSPFGYSPLHPLSLLMVVSIAALCFGLGNYLKIRWNLL